MWIQDTSQEVGVELTLLILSVSILQKILLIFVQKNLPQLLAQRAFHVCLSQEGQAIFLLPGQMPNFLKQVRSSACVKHFKGELVQRKAGTGCSATLNQGGYLRSYIVKVLFPWICWCLDSCSLSASSEVSFKKAQRRFPITKQHALVVGTLGWDAGKLALVPIQTDSFDSENLILLLFPIFNLCPPHPLRHLEEGPCLYIRVATGLGELNNFGVCFLLFCLFWGLFVCLFFHKPLNILIPVLAFSNCYFWGAREAQSTQAGEIIRH